MSFHVTYNFVQGYDAGQKKIVASEMDQNFADIEGYINNSSVNIAETQTITGDKTFTGTVDLSGATVISSDNIPVGSIIWSANATVPAGYLLCNGASVGRDTYPELFAAIGTTYGEGDGSTTFNLPNLIGRFLEGASTAGTVKEAGLPNITGQADNAWLRGGAADGIFRGALYQNGQGLSGLVASGAAMASSAWGFDASRSSPIYGNSTTVQPPAVTALPCIKAFSAVVGDATVVAGQLVNDIQSKVALDGSNASSIGSELSTYMADAAMPSGQSINLTLPASGGTVTAPADGWIFLRKATNPSGVQDVYIGTSSLAAYNINSLTYGGVIVLSLPVKKGDVVTVIYNATGNTEQFRFVYANGSAPTNQ